MKFYADMHCKMYNDDIERLQFYEIYACACIIYIAIHADLCIIVTYVCTCLNEIAIRSKEVMHQQHARTQPSHIPHIHFKHTVYILWTVL